MDQRMVGETDVSNLLGTDICILRLHDVWPHNRLSEIPRLPLDAVRMGQAPAPGQRVKG